MRNLFSHFFVFLIIVAVVGGTLGPDSKKKSKNKEKKKSGESSALPAGDNYQFEADEATRKELKNGQRKLTNFKRKFNSGATLAYVTPWNNHGYDVAKLAAQKFTHVSPVWFQFNEDPNGEANCVISGTHDVDHDWIAAVREANPNIKIVPRFLFQNWPNEFQSFLTSEEYSHRCAQTLVEYILRNEFDGAVVEIWFQVMMTSKGRAGPFLSEIVENWAEMFHRVGLQIIVPLTAPLMDKGETLGIATPQQIESLVEAVDYLSVMTYDFNGETPSGIAPLPWVEENIHYLLDIVGQKSAHKLLLGSNFYGYFYQPKPTPGLIRDFSELLHNADLRFDWDKIAHEHAIRERTGNVLAYLPTKRSIEARLDLAQKLGVGFAIWEIGQAFDNYYDVL